MDQTFHPLLDCAELPPGASKGFRIDGHDILVGNAAGEFFAVQNRCTHQNAPLEGGRIRNGLIACPMHGVMFDVRTGCGRGQMGRVPLRVYALRVIDGRIEVSLDAAPATTA
ncbi:Rieske (2Fe-2S) protein [Thauera linaloolentis]|uniref:Rieske (2Fe-2S) domain-containing protein n=1 Tax=Thauera linaloolentis (strain DSM 12138 / JCM 21573 / CCUG 41526 / CIP 105981 / IAM 15112 / NBRC 102519 / 47Lol) TaxID=1123367 RepID=N6Z059_THAL4|nr:Rieske 2Fe-2S domain-containing protein [Thauera linaloolentis]ENO85559.1 Rieske (2Fe-2S) domain-containing protein [Thauera linaloolentis 47Lol = DSM 12138]MCM8566545.1 Rieske 2Fe-2S domain-containing protein [Thauera linaloolentis]